jgi:hypothetical protein
MIAEEEMTSQRWKSVAALPSLVPDHGQVDYVGMLRSAQCNGLSCSCGFCGVVEGFFSEAFLRLTRLEEKRNG